MQYDLYFTTWHDGYVTGQVLFLVEGRKFFAHAYHSDQEHMWHVQLYPASAHDQFLDNAMSSLIGTLTQLHFFEDPSAAVRPGSVYDTISNSWKLP